VESAVSVTGHLSLADLFNTAPDLRSHGVVASIYTGRIDADRTAHASELLHAQRAALTEQLRAADSELAEVRSLRADGVDDEHDPEGSTLSSDWSRVYGLRQAVVARLDATDRAIEKLDLGTYGTCQICGRPIADGRLLARPEAETCVECAV